MKGSNEDELYKQYIKEELERIAFEYPNVYMTREEIMEKLNFPNNGPNLVVVKSNGKGTGFMRNQYDERYLRGHIDKDEFVKIIDYASKIMKNLYSK